MQTICMTKKTNLTKIRGATPTTVWMAKSYNWKEQVETSHGKWVRTTTKDEWISNAFAVHGIKCDRMGRYSRSKSLQTSERKVTARSRWYNDFTVAYRRSNRKVCPDIIVQTNNVLTTLFEACRSVMGKGNVRQKAKLYYWLYMEKNDTYTTVRQKSGDMQGVRPSHSTRGDYSFFTARIIRGRSDRNNGTTCNDSGWKPVCSNNNNHRPMVGVKERNCDCKNDSYASGDLIRRPLGHAVQNPVPSVFRRRTAVRRKTHHSVMLSLRIEKNSWRRPIILKGG